MTGILASRAFFTRAAIFGTEVTHVGRGGQMTEVMSRTSRAEPLTETSTATGSGIFGIGDVGVGAAVGAGVAGGAVVATATGVGVGDGAAAGVVHEARRAIAAMAGRTRRTLSIAVPYLKRVSSRFRTIVSSNAGRPSFRITSMARFNAGPTSLGSSIGPSLYQPNDRASIAKSGGGSERSMPMFAFVLSVPRLSATRSWCSQSL